MIHTKLLYHLLFMSWSTMQGSDREVDAQLAGILATSRRNNRRDGITSALLFDGACFAQVLEGGMTDVATTFERMQCDPRHRGTVVLQVGPAQRRVFGRFPLAYAGRVPAGRLRFDRVGYRPTDAERMHTASDLLALMHRMIHPLEVV